MAGCRAITGLKLDDKSRRMIKTLKLKKGLKKALSTAVAAGVVLNVFTRNNVPLAALNITQTDWTLFSTAMLSIPKITARAVKLDVNLMILHYQMPYNAKHLAFWEGVKYGCK